MSSFAIESAAKWIAQLMVQEVQYLGEVSNKVESLQQKLEWMQCFLQDADGKQMKSVLLHKCVSDISDLALEAEDIIQTYILKVSYKKRHGVMNTIKWSTKFLMDGRSLHDVGSQIEGITSKISEVSLRMQTYGVRSSNEIGSDMETAKRMVSDQRRTYSHDQHKFIVGLEGDVAKIIRKLQQDPQKIVVVHGMGGIGKTALAREVHHKCLSQDHFVGCAWAYVSQQLNLETVCKVVLRELLSKDKEQMKLIDDLEPSQLPGRLSEILQQKNYLVVLDDVWNSRDWECLEHAFPIAGGTGTIGGGSRILITTRNLFIFSNLGSHLVSTWEAGPLKEDSSWLLLENKAHFNRHLLDSSMVKTAQKMLDHCNGHPLAIVALGGVLVSKNTLEEWESVRENLQTHLKGDDGPNRGVYAVLAMSYHDLDYAMKPCFLHMAHFPEDFEITVEKVANLWVADGIVSSEKIAYDNLNQLIQRAMIQVNRMDVDGVIISCRLHDLMRDKCLEMTREERFLQIMTTTDHEQQQTAAYIINEKVARRLTVYVGKADSESITKLLSGITTSLRSLIFISTGSRNDRKEDGWEWVKSICKRFKLLRVLDFEGGVVLGGALPKHIGKLIYLRHLCLQGTKVTSLPDSIRNLKCLLILDLRVSWVVIKVPNVLWELKSLCFLYFAERLLSQEQDHIQGCSQGYKIENDKLLILDKLSHLEVLSNVDLDKVDLTGLLQLTGIRKLSATCRRSKQSLTPFLASTSIKHLDLIIDASLLMGEDDLLVSGTSSLRGLWIDAAKHPRIDLPIRVEMFPCNLVGLGFWYCLLDKDPMPILGTLPKLQDLRLRICYLGTEINCSYNGFPELTHLVLDGLFSLKDWNVERRGLPKLETVEIYNCPLTKIPQALPPTLQFGCSEKTMLLVDAFRLQANIEASQQHTQNLCSWYVLLAAISTVVSWGPKKLIGLLLLVAVAISNGLIILKLTAKTMLSRPVSKKKREIKTE